MIRRMLLVVGLLLTTLVAGMPVAARSGTDSSGLHSYALECVGGEPRFLNTSADRSVFLTTNLAPRQPLGVSESLTLDPSVDTFVAEFEDPVGSGSFHVFDSGAVPPCDTALDPTYAATGRMVCGNPPGLEISNSGSGDLIVHPGAHPLSPGQSITIPWGTDSLGNMTNPAGWHVTQPDGTWVDNDTYSVPDYQTECLGADVRLTLAGSAECVAGQPVVTLDYSWNDLTNFELSTSWVGEPGIIWTSYGNPSSGDASVSSNAFGHPLPIADYEGNALTEWQFGIDGFSPDGTYITSAETTVPMPAGCFDEPTQDLSVTASPICRDDTYPFVRFERTEGSADFIVHFDGYENGSWFAVGGGLWDTATTPQQLSADARWPVDSSVNPVAEVQWSAHGRDPATGQMLTESFAGGTFTLPDDNPCDPPPYSTSASGVACGTEITARITSSEPLSFIIAYIVYGPDGDEESIVDINLDGSFNATARELRDAYTIVYNTEIARGDSRQGSFVVPQNCDSDTTTTTQPSARPQWTVDCDSVDNIGEVHFYVRTIEDGDVIEVLPGASFPIPHDRYDFLQIVWPDAADMEFVDVPTDCGEQPTPHFNVRAEMARCTSATSYLLGGTQYLGEAGFMRVSLDGGAFGDLDWVEDGSFDVMFNGLGTGEHTVVLELRRNTGPEADDYDVVQTETVTFSCASSTPTTTTSPSAPPPPSPTVTLNGRFGACRFGSNCLIGSFTIANFPTAPTRYTCVFGDGYRATFSFTGLTVNTACYTADRPDSIRVEVNGVSSNTITTGGVLTPPPSPTPAVPPPLPAPAAPPPAVLGASTTDPRITWPSGFASPLGSRTVTVTTMYGALDRDCSNADLRASHTYYLTDGTTEHLGLDLRAPLHTPVYAIGDGIVKRVGTNGLAPHFKPASKGVVLVQHMDTAGRAFTVAYAHIAVGSSPLSGQRWQAGDVVRQGDRLGTTTELGEGMRPHLHIGVVDGVHTEVPAISENRCVHDARGTSDPLTFLASRTAAPLTGSIVGWRNSDGSITSWRVTVVSGALRRYWIPSARIYYCVRDAGGVDWGPMPARFLDQLADRTNHHAAC